MENKKLNEMYLSTFKTKIKDMNRGFIFGKIDADRIKIINYILEMPDDLLNDFLEELYMGDYGISITGYKLYGAIGEYLKDPNGADKTPIRETMETLPRSIFEKVSYRLGK